MQTGGLAGTRANCVVIPLAKYLAADLSAVPSWQRPTRVLMARARGATSPTIGLTHVAQAWKALVSAQVATSWDDVPRHAIDALGAELAALGAELRANVLRAVGASDPLLR